MPLGIGHIRTTWEASRGGHGEGLAGASVDKNEPIRWGLCALS